METDNQLLEAYARRGSEGAFRELVQRHINLVHSAALREAGGNEALAEDITQEVFAELARRAATLASHPVIAGWLYTSVRLTAANVRRANNRRQRREQEAFTMNELLGPGQTDELWRQVRPVLDDVMHELDHEDRTAVVLRFFEGHSHKEVGAALGLTENAARMRVERSLEKLHGLLSRRGIRSTAATLAAVLMAGAAASTSSAFAASVATGAMATAAAGTAAAASGTTLLAVAKTKTAAACALALVASALLVWYRLHSTSTAAAVAPATVMPVAVASTPKEAVPNDSVVPVAPATNAVAAAQSAFQFADAASGDPLPGTKLYLFYLLPDGRGKRVHAVTDADGRLAVDIPSAPYAGLNMFVTADGHVPKVTSWGFGRTMPSAYTMKLDPGATISGVVVDEAGAALPGAKIEFDTGGNDRSLAENIQFGPDTPVITDANGRWSCNLIPKDSKPLSLLVTGGGHAETNVTVHWDAPDANQLVITMPAGFSVSGLVQDLNGNPVAGATVRQPRLNGENEQSATTDASGAFELKSLAGGDLMLVVQADSFAPVVDTLQVTGNMSTLDFKLGPGQLLRGWVIDEAGNPVTNAFVETTRRGIDKVKWSTNTDVDGRFEWNSAPKEPLLYSVLADGFNHAYAQSLPADGTEHEIKLTRQQPEKDNVQITGTVVDADTGVSLDGFKVMVGELEPDWAFPLRYYTDGQKGKFTVSLSAKAAHPGYQIQIEKDGYLPGTSAEFQLTNGNQTLEFSLHPGTGPSGLVLLPDGEPAVNATVLLCTSLQGVTLGGPAQVRTGLNATPYFTKTDGAGKFSLAAAAEPQAVIIVHDQGFADVSLAELAAGGNLTLQAWGGLKGRLMIGSQPAANESIVAWNQVTHYSASGRLFGHLTYRFETTTDADGSFSFEKLPPGRCEVFQQQSVAGVLRDMSQNTSVTVAAGAVTDVVLGGKGRAIVGKAVLPAAAGTVDWQKVVVRLHSGADPGPRPKRENFPTVGAYIAAEESQAQAWQNQQHYSCVCDSDGAFRLLDVPAGTYELKIEVRDFKDHSAAPHDISDPSPVLDSIVREVVVPGDDSAEPLDLGTLELAPQALSQN